MGNNSSLPPVILSTQVIYIVHFVPGKVNFVSFILKKKSCILHQLQIFVFNLALILYELYVKVNNTDFFFKQFSYHLITFRETIFFSLSKIFLFCFFLHKKSIPVICPQILPTFIVGDLSCQFTFGLLRTIMSVKSTLELVL